MPEGPEPRLAGLDAERPLPPALYARLEAALLHAAAAPPASPAPWVGETAPPDASEIALDAPRPLPPPVHARVEAALLAGGRTRWTPWLRPGLAAAAVLALVVVSAALLGRPHPSDRDVTAAGPGTTRPAPTAPAALVPPPPPDGSALDAFPAGGPAPAARTPAPGRASPRPDRSPRPGPSAAAPDEAAPPPPAPVEEAPPSRTAGPPEGTAGNGSGDGSAGPPPPYAFPSESDGAAPALAAPPPSAGTEPAPSAPSGPPLRIGVVGGDRAQETGFSAYVDLLNRSGGVRGRRLELVPAGPGAPASGTIATVNLSPRPVAAPGGAPGWATGPLLESLLATEDLLPAGGPVFSFSSPPERQAHLAVDAVFPEPAPGATAVVYRAHDGPLAGAVARAFEEVLGERGVSVSVETYDPARPPALLQSADAAFLSLDTGAARSWLRQARTTIHPRGVAGIFSLFDPALLPDLPEGIRVTSPYVVPPGGEGEAIRSGAGEPSAAVLHGWATAKSLAVALWRTGADTPEEALAAVEGLTGYHSGLAPPYETRPGTRSRTPEGILLEVRSGAFVTQGGFRRDPH
jgi:hypothetical protein